MGRSASHQREGEGEALLDASAEVEAGSSGESTVSDALLDVKAGYARSNAATRRGFIAYSVACEVFSIVSLGLFLPVLLEQMAREHGALVPDHLLPCPKSATSDAESDGDAVRCAVRFLGSWLDTASFSLYTYSASVAVQALCVISLGALADHPHDRHQLLTIFALMGSLLTISFITVPSSSIFWPLSALLALGANVSFGCSMVCLNSYLPDLGRNEPSVFQKFEAVQDATASLKIVRSASHPNGDDLLSASQKLARVQEEYVTARAFATSRISSRGVAAGYASGIFSLICLLIPVTMMKGSTLSLQLAICGSGLLWLCGSIPALRWLRPGPGSALSRSSLNDNLWGQIAKGWKGLGMMLKEWRRLPATFQFLAAWFLLSDAFSTLTSTAMLFGKTSLRMSTPSLILIAIISPASGIAGAILFPRLQKTVLRTSNLKTLVLLVSCATIVPIWGIVALGRSWQMYPLAVCFGALYGAFQSYARTCFSDLVPASQAARWFGLYSITDKSSSFLGPLLVAFLTNATGNIRHGFYLILAMLVIAIPILFTVDVDRGRQDVETYEHQLWDESLEEDASEG